MEAFKSKVNIKDNMFLFFKSFIKKKNRFQNITNFPFDIKSKQRF